MSSLLPHGVDCSAVEYPGHGRRQAESPLVNISDLGAELANRWRPVQRGLYGFFGHCMGGIVAFETCHEIARLGGRQPHVLVVSGQGAPHVEQTYPPFENSSHDPIIDYLRSLNGTPTELFSDADALEPMMRALRADIAACRTYSVGRREPLSIDILLYGGTEDPRTTRENLEAWTELSTGRLSTRLFTGDHFFIKTNPSRVAQALAQDLKMVASRFRLQEGSGGRS
jgi:medium-chain acyl-[acyl-carrier-protein] hydrolase